MDSGDIFGITILLFYVFDNILLSKTFKELYLGGVVLIVVYFSFSSFFTYRPLNGSLKDEIEFGDDGIKLGNKLFEWKSINNLDFKFLNYYGKSSLGISGDFNSQTFTRCR